MLKRGFVISLSIGGFFKSRPGNNHPPYYFFDNQIKPKQSESELSKRLSVFQSKFSNRNIPIQFAKCVVCFYSQYKPCLEEAVATEMSVGYTLETFLQISGQRTFKTYFINSAKLHLLI